MERIARMHNRLHRLARLYLIHPSWSGPRLALWAKVLLGVDKAGPSAASAMAKLVLSDKRLTPEVKVLTPSHCGRSFSEQRDTIPNLFAVMARSVHVDDSEMHRRILRRVERPRYARVHRRHRRERHRLARGDLRWTRRPGDRARSGAQQPSRRIRDLGGQFSSKRAGIPPLKDLIIVNHVVRFLGE
jgi:hypothetical protein